MKMLYWPDTHKLPNRGVGGILFAMSIDRSDPAESPGKKYNGTIE